MGSRLNRVRILLLAASFCLTINPGLFFIDRDVALSESFRASKAELTSLEGEPFNVSASSTDSRAPALAVWWNDVHIVWEERGRVYHRFLRGGTWSPIRSVATGEQPDIVVDTSGMAHVVLVNEFGGNYEIYHCRWNGTTWSLPRNVSNTSGVSSSPAIAVAPDGMLHVVWADNTPGYNVIYHAYWNGTYWINEPIPNALGGAPAIAVDMDGMVHVVWQDRDTPTSPYEIYYSRWDGASWSLPENLSDSAMEQSIIPSLAVDGSNEAHILWQERINSRYTIYYTWGRVGFWSIPERVSEDDADAYLPSAAIAPGNIVYAGWDESTVILYCKRVKADNSPWGGPTLVVSDTQGVADVQLAVGANGQLHAVWA
ncbi:MAG: hypothetical protein ACPLRM_01450, partial [Anaerolineae bacterium]